MVVSSTSSENTEDYTRLIYNMLQNKDYGTHKHQFTLTINDQAVISENELLEYYRCLKR